MKSLLRRGAPVVVVIGLFCLARAGQAWGDSPSKKGAPHGATELYDSLRQTINAGAKLFNDNSDPAGCYHLFEGALISIRPYVSKDLQKEVDVGLERATKMPSVPDKAFELRRVIDAVRTRYQPVWVSLGGEEKVMLIVKDWAEAVLTDPKIDLDRNGKIHIDQNALQVDLAGWLSATTGGPYEPWGPIFSEAVPGVRLTDDQFGRVQLHLQTALRKNGARAQDVSGILTDLEVAGKQLVAGAPKQAPHAAAGEVPGKVASKGKR